MLLGDEADRLHPLTAAALPPLLGLPLWAIFEAAPDLVLEVALLLLANSALAVVRLRLALGYLRVSRPATSSPRPGAEARARHLPRAQRVALGHLGSPLAAQSAG